MNVEPNEEGQKEGKAKPGRHPYVHKPFLYSKYYSDSDDEETVVQRRQSIVSWSNFLLFLLFIFSNYEFGCGE